MSFVRRRSRDPNHETMIQDEEETIRKRSSSLSGSKIITYLAVGLLFVLAVSSVTWYRWQPHVLPPFTAHQEVQSQHEDSRYWLHPHDHIGRPPKTLRFQWRITKERLRPDGVLKDIYCINGLFPGPTIEARSGDHLIIEVENALEDEGTSLHWHGLSMRDANAMDGAVGITQNATLPGETYTYDFTIEQNQYGTFWYHAHSQIQRADGLYGGLIVHEPAKKALSVDEHLLMIGDWYHRSAEEALHFYMHPGSFGNEPVPDSILLNGNGIFDCDDAVPARPLDCKQQTRGNLAPLRIDNTRQTMLRIVNVGSYAGVELKIDGARLTPLRVDGGHAVSAESATTVGFLHPGERLDILVEQIGTETFSHGSLEVTLDTSPFKYPNPSLTSTHQFPVSWQGSKRTRPRAADATMGRFGLETISSAEDQSSLLTTSVSQVVILYAITQKLSHLKNEPRGFINNTYWTAQSNPPQPLISLSRELWDKHQFVPRFKYDQKQPQWIDIVLNNLDEEGHPFHLHGYDFWVLSSYSSTYNWGSYNPFEDEEAPGGSYDLVGAIKKDTFQVPRRGYAVLRVRVDNPGIWMFHCHNLWHQASGMAMAFEVD